MTDRSTDSASDRLWYLMITVLVLIADQLTKYWVATSLQSRGDITVIKGLLTFSYTENRGIAFGMFNNENMQWFLVSISVAAIGVVVFYLLRSSASNRTLLVSLSLLAGGIGGNLIDRIRLGRVIDFIEVSYHSHYWPVFNMADTAISIGAILLALDLFLSPHYTQKDAISTTPQPGGPAGAYAQEPAPSSYTGEPPASV